MSLYDWWDGTLLRRRHHIGLLFGNGYVHMYAVCTMPLIDACCGTQSSVDCDAAIQVWYADDAAAGDRLRALRVFWDIII